MRDFNFKAEYQKLLTPEVVAYLTQIHEYKGQQNLFIEAKADALSNLLEVAKIQSTEASNRIEGIITTDDRLKKIVREKTMPQSRSEKEIAGYRDVLATIHESHDYIPPKPTVILQLHRDLYKFSGKSIGGSFKNSDNVIAEERPDGRKIVRFEPVSAWETPGAMTALCDAFQTAAQDAELDPLLLIPIFILDFLCIHPFNDGNGRMSRLLTLLMLYRNGYMVGKYISIEHLIEQSKSIGVFFLGIGMFFYFDRIKRAAVFDQQVDLIHILIAIEIERKFKDASVIVTFYNLGDHKTFKKRACHRSVFQYFRGVPFCKIRCKPGI